MVTDYPRSLRPPADSFFLFGIRGVGKSTWARQQFPTAQRQLPAGTQGAYQLRANLISLGRNP